MVFDSLGILVELQDDTYTSQRDEVDTKLWRTPQLYSPNDVSGVLKHYVRTFLHCYRE